MNNIWLTNSPIGRTPLEQPDFIPMSKNEMDSLGWNELDILLVSGDAYIDHPSFAAALLGRWLIAHGYRTGIVAQPRWDSPEDLTVMGRPRLYAGISAGALDSMLGHYTAFRKKRSDDAYTPGGQAGARPNRAVLVYTSLVRQAFPGIPTVIGGIEASLRRITHYDFWSDKVRRPILFDSKADCLVYGMGERAMLELAARLDEQGADSGIPFPHIALGTPGTAVIGTENDLHGVLPDSTEQTCIQLPSHETIEANPKMLMEATILLEKQVHGTTSWAIQPVGKRAVLIAPPAPMLTTEKMDSLYDLPYSRKAHPSYDKPIPAEAMIESSITTHRGCGGGCSFCSLALHHGRRIASRSEHSILQEVDRMSTMPHFKGSISDVGGPSANMWGARCSVPPEKCKRESCMHPSVCKQFTVNQSDAIHLLRTIRNKGRVNHVRVASGVRFDLGLQEEKALRAYTMEFTGGQLKVAPEHICDSVLGQMRKPTLAVFEKFLKAFARYSEEAGKEQYVIPYLMSAFPGCTDKDMYELKAWLDKRGWKPQQVQCFIPTPGTVATAMYYAGIDPDGATINVARTDAERLRQHHILMPDMGNKKNSAAGKGRGGNTPGNRSGRRDKPAQQGGSPIKGLANPFNQETDNASHSPRGKKATRSKGTQTPHGKKQRTDGRKQGNNAKRNRK